MKRSAILHSPVPSSLQHTAAFFAFIKLRRRSQVSPFRGWSSASFTDIRVCLCGWVMDLLCWYVLLWWLQRPILRLGSFYWTVTQWLLCFRRWLFTQQTPWSSNSPTYPHTVNLPVPVDPLAAQRSQTKRPGTKHEAFVEIWNMYFSLLFIVCIFFWYNTSAIPHFPFLSGTARFGGQKGGAVQKS